jgi:signal transduction histidine kinase
MADWLADHGLDTAMAEVLADTAVRFEELDRLAGAVDGSGLSAALRWAAAGCAVRGLASEIQDSAMRISGLVVAIKGFTHMDRASVAEPVDLIQGLSNTVAVLKSKARAKSVAVAVQVEPGLPRVRGFAGELNQIWGNLLMFQTQCPTGCRSAGKPRRPARNGACGRQREQIPHRSVRETSTCSSRWP